MTIDLDGEFDPLDIFNVLFPIIKNEADIVIGSRYSTNLGLFLPKKLSVFEYFSDQLFKYLIHRKINDNFSTFRAFKKPLLKLFREMNYNTLEFLTEFLIKAAFYKYKIYETQLSTTNSVYGYFPFSFSRLLKFFFRMIFKYGLRKSHYNFKNFYPIKLYDSMIKRIEKRPENHDFKKFSFNPERLINLRHDLKRNSFLFQNIISKFNS